MKILITVSTYFPAEDGVSRVTQYIAEELVRDGHNVTVITEQRDTLPEKETYAGVKIKRVRLFTKYGLYFGEKKQYRDMIQKETKRNDIMINVCTQNAFTDTILNKINTYKCKKILYMHGMFCFKFHALDFNSFPSIVNKIWKEIRWFFYYSFKGKYFKKYDSIIQLHEKDYANTYFERKYGIKSSIIGNAVDNSFFELANDSSFVKPFDKYILYVANYGNNKNQKLAISEFLKSAICPEVGLVLIGSKENRYCKYLERFITKERQRLGISEKDKPILLLKGVQRNMIPHYVKNALLYIMTSRAEVFPVSIAESIATGTPFVSTDVGVVKYFMGGVTSSKDDISYWIKVMVNNNDIRNSFSNVALDFAKKNLKIRSKIELLEKELNHVMGEKYV